MNSCCCFGRYFHFFDYQFILPINIPTDSAVLNKIYLTSQISSSLYSLIDNFQWFY